MVRGGAVAILLVLFSALSFASVEWVFASPGKLLPDTALLPSSVIAASSDGSIYSLSSSDGALEWTYDAGEPMDASPCAVSSTEIAIATRSGKVSIISAGGKELFSFATNGTPVSLACGGKRVFVSSENSVSSWTNQGKQVWNVSVGSLPGQLGYFGKSLYFTSGKKLYSLSSQTGYQNWAADAEDSFLSRPTEAGEAVLVGATDGRLYSFNRQNGARRWSFLAGGWITSTPLFYDDMIFFGSTDGNLYAISDFANLIFKFKAGEGVWSSPILHQAGQRNIIVFGSTDGKLYGVDSQTGARAWSFSTSGRVNSPRENGDAFVFTTDHSKLYAVSSSPMCAFTDPRDGEVVGPWQIEVKGNAHSDSSLSGVEVRASGGSWVQAEGKGEWIATIDLAPFSDGPVTLECRARDTSGKIESGEYASLSLTKMQNTPLRPMGVGAPARVKLNEKFNISAKDVGGSPLRGVTIAIGEEKKVVDSPYELSFTAPGIRQVSVDKSGYQPVNFTVSVQGNDLPLIPIAGVIVVLAILIFAIKSIFGKK